jgi:hypothetical protein
VVAPITDLLKGKQKGKKAGPFERTSAAEEAFRDLKDQFQRAPLLKHYDPDLDIRVEKDASGNSLRGILSQRFAEGW